MPLFGKGKKDEASEETVAMPEPLNKTPKSDGPFNWPHALERPALTDLPFLFKALENRVHKLEARVSLSNADATVAREAAKAGAELDVKATFTPGPDSTMTRLLRAEKEMVTIQAQKAFAGQQLQEERRKHSKNGQAHLLRLERLHHAQEIVYDERLAALKQISQVETERAQISVEKDEIESKLKLHRENLQDAKPGKQRAQLQATLKKLEADLGAKVNLTRDLDAALAKVSEAEQERAHILAKNQKSYADFELGEDDNGPLPVEDTSDYPDDASIDKLAAEFRRERDYNRGVTTRLQVKLAEMMEMMASMLEGNRGHGHHHAKSSQDGRKHPDKMSDEVTNMSDTELLVRVRESLGEIGMQLNHPAPESAV